jgi:hypothetical protein
MDGLKKSLGLLALVAVAAMGGCGGGGSDTAVAPVAPPTAAPPEAPPANSPAVATLRIGILPDTQGSDSGVALHPMKAILDLYEKSGVDVVLAVGDLVENGTASEYKLWRDLAEKYRGKMTILPIMGNHDPKGIDQDWHDTVESFIPADAEHMPGSREKNYVVVRGNVLLINISYGWVERSYDFVEAMVAKHGPKADHIIFQTHNSFVGNRYGLVRENIVDGSNAISNDVKFRDVYDKYRKLFAEHDVIYVSGHEHHYSRSVIRDDSDLAFTQIISGNSAYKGYESRFGEHEKIQSMLMLKVQNEITGSIDANASIFTITGPTVDYRSYFVTHSVFSNADAPGPLAAPEWKMLDRFVRTKDRCDKVVYPSSVPADVQRNGVYDPSYRTSPCVSAGGSRARLLDGRNDIFNRHDTRTRTMSATPGYSFANSNREMESMMYRYMYIRDESFSRNLNNSQRARIVDEGTPDEEVEVRGTTIDLKKQVSLNWKPADADTLSDQLVISGIVGQDGTYIDAYGRAKDIEADAGLAGSFGDGTEQAKAPVVLGAHAKKGWSLAGDKMGDRYVLEFSLPKGRSVTDTMLARFDEGSGTWVALTTPACVSRATYRSAYLSAAPADVDAACGKSIIVGHDAQASAYWARLNQEGRFAIVARP